MKNTDKRAERDNRAARLKMARERADLGSYRKLATRFGWNENTYKSHEQGKSSFDQVDARKYAKAFGVSLQWLFMGVGAPDDADDHPTHFIDVPLVSWVSAGALTDQDGVADLADFPVVTAVDLPEGDWIALRVDGNSMNKISPPDSIIFANRRDKRLVPNACYVVADETGAATYKRYRPNMEPPFQSASYEEVAPPAFKGATTIVGRVRRSVIDL